MNEAYEELARAFSNVHVINVHMAVIGNGYFHVTDIHTGKTPYFSNRDIHFNTEGHKRLRDLFIKAFNEHS